VKKQTYRIGPIAFSIEANGDRFPEIRKSFQFFQAPGSPRLRYVFHRLPAAGTERAARNFPPPKGLAALSGSASPLLASRRVRERLRRTRIDPRLTALELKENAVTILDFSRLRADLFRAGPGEREREAFGFGPGMLGLFLPAIGACLLHAAAIVRDGRAAILLAPDEGGKTTAVRLAPSGIILCDDQVIVMRGQGGFHVWGTPWGLHVTAGAHAPLAGLFLLKKARRFQLRPLSRRALAAAIRLETAGSLAILPRELRRKAGAIIDALVAAAPAWTLAFPKDHIDWREVDEALRMRTGNTGKRERERPFSCSR
jgi:hypothetical protein